MYQQPRCLPHLLPSSAYGSDSFYNEECRNVLRTAWHFVGIEHDLSEHGCFLTVDLFGHSIQVRNFKGKIRALSNICAHRHCRIASAKKGMSESMRCPYHGWEYGPSGKTTKIPAPENFVGLDARQTRLPQYRLEKCGALLFVNLDAEALGLRDFLGPLFSLCEERFGAGWEPFLSWNPDNEVNWKIPVENSLEAYHVNAVHGNTFGTDPGEERSVHELNDRFTLFRTTLPFNRRSRRDLVFQDCEDWLVNLLGAEPSRSYSHMHVFPNLLLSFTDAVSICQGVTPTGPGESSSVIRQFGLVGEGGKVWLGRLWGRLKSCITKRILEEDLGLFSEVQAGLSGSPHAGVLARCEERIYAFHEYLKKEMPDDDEG